MITVLCSYMIVAASAATADGWWDPAWKYRQRVDINTSALTEDLVDFPLSLRLTDGQFARTRCAEGGRDLRAVSADGTVLACEIVRWTPDAVEVNIRLPKVGAKATGEHIDLYYGNPGAPAAPGGAIWSAHYRDVLHLAGNLNNVVTGQPGANVVEGVRVADGAVFDAPKGYLDLEPKLLEGLGEQITLAIRFKVRGSAGVQTLASGLRDDRSDWFNFGLKLPNIVHTNAVSHGQTAPELNPAGIAPDEWHAAVVRYDARNHTRTICIDGTVIESDNALPGPLAVNAIHIGRGVLHFDSWQFQGVIDEVRLADAARSDGWMKAEAACLSDKNAFVAIGAPQANGEPAPPPAPFDLVAPADGAQVRKRGGVTAQWRPSAGAEGYVVRLSADAAGAQALNEIDTKTSTQVVIPPDAAAGKPLYWTVVAKSSRGEMRASETRHMTFYDWSTPMTSLPKDTVTPAMSSARDTAIELQGYLRKRVDNVIQRWFLEVPESSPAILQVFRDRDRTPVRDPLVPWAGEFAGKFLTSGELNWRLTHDTRLKSALDDFARKLIACQADDGYLGPFPKSSRLTGANWDVWGHYHCMLGLMLYHEDTGYAPALEACKKAADLLFETFGPGGPSLTCDGSQGQMNMAACHSLVLLYKKTGAQRYLDLAQYIVNDAWNEAGAGQYLKSALAGNEVYEFPAHRWEALHDYEVLPELYWLTGNDDYRRAFEHIWWSILRGDRHNNGGFSSGEGCTGSPYNQGAIETCCTVAWQALSVDMLRLTGDARVADELEWSAFNSGLGSLPYSGRACAYNVPMDGARTFGVELPWQAPKAGPDLNCCSVNSPRTLGMVSEWALVRSNDGLTLNFYGPGKFSAALPSGNRVTLTEETTYPADGRVRIRVEPERAESFTLSLRIPRWSKKTQVSVNGQASEPIPGTYLALARGWKAGDQVEIAFDFSLHYWAGQQECANKISIYRGPILLTYDARYNTLDPDQLPVLDWKTATVETASFEGDLEPWLLTTLKSGDHTVSLVDFSSAGQTGNQYRSWLPARDLPPSPFYLKEAADGMLKWDKRAGADSWTVLIAKTRDFKDATKLEGLTQPEVKPSLSPGEYYWTVIAANANGTTDAGNGPMPLVVK